MPIGKCGWWVRDPKACDHCEQTIIDKVDCMDEADPVKCGYSDGLHGRPKEIFKNNRDRELYDFGYLDGKLDRKD